MKGCIWLKKVIWIIIIMFILFMNGCKHDDENSDSNTYDDLTSNQQEIIDLVYSFYDEWSYYSNSGKEWECTNVTFFEQSESLIFSSYYSFSNYEKVGDDTYSKRGASLVYDVDVTSGKITKHEYSIFEKAEKGGAYVQAMNGSEFDVDSDEQTKKDVLSNAYYKKIIKES